jgi:hypothetical protein
MIDAGASRVSVGISDTAAKKADPHLLPYVSADVRQRIVLPEFKVARYQFRCH